MIAHVVCDRAHIPYVVVDKPKVAEVVCSNEYTDLSIRIGIHDITTGGSEVRDRSGTVNVPGTENGILSCGVPCHWV